MTYSIDFRKKVIGIKAKEKLSIAKTAKRFGIGTSTIVNWIKNIVAKIGRNKPASKIDMQALAKDIKEYPDAYAYERAARLGCSKRSLVCAKTSWRDV
jgi:transposase